MARVFTAAGLLVLCVASASAETVTKTVRDWTASCDEYSCKALTTGAGGLAMGETGYQLEIARAAGGNEVWFVTLIARNVPQPGQEPVVFDIADVLSRETVVEGAGDDRFGLADQQAIEAIFPALKKGSRLAIRYKTGDGAVEQDFSLSGLAAVMLWMDERQGQVGRSDGVKAIAVRDDIRLSVSDLKDLEDQVLEATHLTNCEWAVEGNEDAKFDARKYDLGGGYGLVIVQCSMGAYQDSNLIFLEGSEGLEPQPFPDYDSVNGWGATLILGTVDFDGKTLELHHYARFRGPGDCGTWSNYRWNEGRFKLLEYAYRDCPESDEAADPEGEIPEFPIIYKAKD